MKSIVFCQKISLTTYILSIKYKATVMILILNKFSNLVKGMKIKPTPNYALNCYICIQWKISNNRNKSLDCKATKILALVHSDLRFKIKDMYLILLMTIQAL